MSSFIKIHFFAGRYLKVQKDLIFQEIKDLKRAIMLLQFSVKKFKPYKTWKIYTPDELEYYDSLSFRFEKGVELTLI